MAASTGSISRVAVGVGSMRVVATLKADRATATIDSDRFEEQQ